MQTRGTKFCKFQSAKLQELPDQVPVGHVPRCIDVQIRGSLTRIMLPGSYVSAVATRFCCLHGKLSMLLLGDIVTLSGIFLPARNTVSHGDGHSRV